MRPGDRHVAALAFAFAVLPLAAPPRVCAATAYVSDELVLGVYAQQNQQGARLTTLHSGARVETLGVEGEYTQVQLADGTTGWVKSAFLVAHEPAAARVKELEDEISRARATTPGLAEAAARSELERLRQELADKQSQLQSALERNAAAGPARPPDEAAAGQRSAVAAGLRRLLWPAAGAGAVLLLLGYWMGYAALARRVRRKFGGIKVY
jgi:hypothetical protein